MTPQQARRDFFNRLVRAIALAQEYELDQRRIDPIIHPVVRAVRKAVAPIVIQPHPEGLRCSGQPVGGPAADWLQRFLEERGIGRIVLVATASEDQLWRLVLIVAQPPHILERHGGPGVLHRKYGRSPIQLESTASAEVEVDRSLEFEELSLANGGPGPQSVPAEATSDAGDILRMIRALSVEADREKRFALIDAIAECGRLALPTLRNARGSWFLKRNILHIVARIGAAEGLDLVVRMLSAEDERTRLEAVRTIGRIPCETSYSLLVDLAGVNGAKATQAAVGTRLSPASALTVRTTAIRALGCMPGSRITDVLESLLEKPRARGASAADVRRAAADALALHGSAFAWRALSRATRKGGKIARIAQLALESKSSTSWRSS